jgi:peptide-methionine (S)-S-oxide reductase
VELDYDPTIVAYEQLLDAFWSGHDAALPSYSRQYRSAIFYSTEKQHQLAIDSMKKEESRADKRVFTEIEPLTRFYLAEDYHQKYYLLETLDLGREIRTIYPDIQDFINSTAAARLNGYIAGYGNEDTLQKQIGRFGLSEQGKQTLVKIAGSGLTPGCPIQKSDK